MFGFFKSKGPKMPEFTKLKESPLKDKYFYRVASWIVLDTKYICITDPNSPRVITMDAWPQLVFLEADGLRTVEEFIHWMAKQYSRVPDKLDETILFEIEQLVSEGLLKISDKSVELDPDFVGPIKR